MSNGKTSVGARPKASAHSHRASPLAVLARRGALIDQHSQKVEPQKTKSGALTRRRSESSPRSSSRQTLHRTSSPKIFHRSNNTQANVKSARGPAGRPATRSRMTRDDPNGQKELPRWNASPKLHKHPNHVSGILNAVGCRRTSTGRDADKPFNENKVNHTQPESVINRAFVSSSPPQQAPQPFRFGKAYIPPLPRPSQKRTPAAERSLAGNASHGTVEPTTSPKSRAASGGRIPRPLSRTRALITKGSQRVPCGAQPGVALSSQSKRSPSPRFFPRSEALRAVRSVLEQVLSDAVRRGEASAWRRRHLPHTPTRGRHGRGTKTDRREEKATQRENLASDDLRGAPAPAKEIVCPVHGTFTGDESSDAEWRKESGREDKDSSTQSNAGIDVSRPQRKPDRAADPDPSVHGGSVDADEHVLPASISEFPSSRIRVSTASADELDSILGAGLPSGSQPYNWRFHVFGWNQRSEGGLSRIPGATAAGPAIGGSGQPWAPDADSFEAASDVPAANDQAKHSYFHGP